MSTGMMLYFVACIYAVDFVFKMEEKKEKKEGRK